MLKTLLTPLLLLITFTGFAQYQTPGTGVKWSLNDLVTNSGGSVTFSNNTYFFNDSITVAQNDTLQILTNETVKLDNSILFTIAGTLLVNPSDSVVFTAVNPTSRFHSFRFEEFSDGSVLRKTIIEYGNGIKLLNSDMLFDSCTIRNHGRSLSGNSGAISLTGSSPRILNCTFYGNVRAAISSPTNGGCSPVIRNCIIENNATENGNYPQINLGPGGSAPIIIDGNSIIGNTASNLSGGVAVSNLLGGASITTVQINNNTIRNNRYGITLTGGNIQAHIINNLIENNNTNSNAMTGGSGINFYNTNTTQRAIVARNIIRGNLWGITLQSGSSVQSGPQISLGRINRTDTSDVGLNQIYNNGNGGQTYDVYNNTADTVWAQNNFWNTTDTTLIEDHIYHKADNSAHGVVMYLPFAQPTAVKSVIANATGISAYPNPASEFVHIKVAGVAKGAEPVMLDIFNVYGGLVASVPLTNSGNSVEGQWQLQNITNGLYIGIPRNNQKLNIKIVVSK